MIIKKNSTITIMNEIKKNQVLSVLNGSLAKESYVFENKIVSMGIGICEIRCMRVNVSGSNLSKS
jgi:hypothetical protein